VLGPKDIGHRVVVRRIVEVRANRPVYADVLGELIALGETDITIRARAGEVTVARAEVVAARRIPDARRLSASEALQRVAVAGWPAPEREPLGDWLLRAAGGWTNRGNSALALGSPGMPLAAAVDLVAAWYRARGLRPGVMVPAPVGGRVTAELRGRGWVPQPPVLVQTAPLAAVVAATPGSGAVRLDETPSAGWLAVIAGRKGDLPAAARHILCAERPVRFAQVDAESLAPAAVAHGTVPGEGDWLGLSLIEVAPPLRRRGLARAVIGALARWATDLGATRAYLQVEERNTAAVALYSGLGFATHHTYATWNPPS
jgi:GNAT superfamily N-acetyltransferase